MSGLGLLVASAPAHADDFEHAIPELVTAPAAAAKWLEGCSVLVTPRGEVRRPCKIALADLVGAQTGVTLKPTHVKSVSFPRSMLTWNEADVEARVGGKVIATFRLIEIGSSLGNPDGPNGGWSVTAQSWTRIVSDKEATDRAKAGKLVAPKLAGYTEAPGKELDDQDKSDREAGLESLKSQWTSTEDKKPLLGSMLDDDAVVFGSAGERLSGKASAKAIRKWPLGLRQQGALAIGGDKMVQWAVTQVIGTSNGVAIPFTTFVVYIQRLTDGGSFTSAPAIVAFGVPAP